MILPGILVFPTDEQCPSMEPPMRITERLKALIQGVLASVYERYPTPLLKAQTDDKVAQLILQHQFRAMGARVAGS